MKKITASEETTKICPDCGSIMNLKTAGKGIYAGKQFYGCSSFPSCKKIVNIDSEDTSSDLQPKDTTNIPVSWKDRAKRKGWYSEYISIGSMPSFSSELYKDELGVSELKKVISQTFLLENSMRKRSDNKDAKFIGLLVMKLLQRGRSPFCTKGIEDFLIEEFSLDKMIISSEDKADIKNELKSSSTLSEEAIINNLAKRNKFVFDEELNVRNSNERLFDSPFEREFFNKLIPNKVNKEACHWLIPQANLDLILQSNGIHGTSSRRVDFLFSHPNDVFVIELDGQEHNEDKETDQERDDALATCRIEVIRIPNSEVEVMSGTNITNVIKRISDALNNSEPSNQITPLTKSFLASTYATKFQYSIARALKNGWLNSDKWTIKVSGLKKISSQATQDLIRMLSSYDDIYSTLICPKNVVLISDEGLYEISLKEIKKIKSAKTEDNIDLRIAIESDKNPYHAVTGESDDNVEDIIIRPCYLPITMATEDIYPGERRKMNVTHSLDKNSLNNFIQNIFRKESFRAAQIKSIENLLKNNDTIILLPTGAGKSFIYQMAGLLMPGITLVIDPIVALMEDQVEGLNQYGIDRISDISSSHKNRNELIKRTKNGEFQFIFISPERLQMPEFREAIRGLAQTSIINLAVLDEAHCVSEWGHDFRPAYLNVSRNIRNIGKDKEGIPPPMAALTGTASRSVLRDVMADLEIDQSNSESIIRPDNFDRKELNFYVVKADNPNYSATSLSGALKILPEKFNIPKSEFFQTNGSNTYSGVVFVPYAGKGSYVNYGVKKTQEIVENTTSSVCTMYSGGNPNKYNNWDTQKRKNIRDFKYNNISLLVATKAFGMGIDKSNIRFTLHYGIPGSLESFYQEAGRAGRDRRNAQCGIIYSEFSETTNNALLDPKISLDELKKLYSKKIPLAERDDVNRQLFFHLKSFEGIPNEVQYVQDILKTIKTLDRDHYTEIRFTGNNDQKSKEKALHRLTKIGVINDYEVNYSKKLFIVQVTIFDLEKCKDNLLNYVALSTPGRVKTFKNKLKEIDDKNSKQNAFKLSKLLIDFTYDIVERARRSALSETVRLARNSSNDNEIRSRILDYLQEGVGATQIEELVMKEVVELKDWMEKIDLALTPVDASELRGLSMRFLESYPDHPGLLLTRSVTEMICSQNDEVISSQNLYSSYQSSREKYDIANAQWINILKWIGSLQIELRKKIMPVVAVAFYKLIKDKVIINEWLENYFIETISKAKDPYLSCISDIYESSLCIDELEQNTNLILTALNDKKLNKLLV